MYTPLEYISIFLCSFGAGYILAILIIKYKVHKYGKRIKKVNPDWQKQAMINCIHKASKDVDKVMGLLEKRKTKEPKEILKKTHRNLLDIK